MKVTFIIGGLALLALACGSSASSAPPSGEIDAAQARAKAVAVVPGTASEPATLDKGDQHRWVVTVRIVSGASVNVELARATGVVEEIFADEGPFDYELPAPAAGLMTFGQAKAKALAAKPGAVEKWEVKPPTNLYALYVRDGAKKLWEIKMSADKGEVASVIQKDTAD